MKPFGNITAAKHPNRGRQQGIERSCPTHRRQGFALKIDVSALGQRMNASVGSPGSVNAKASSACTLESAFEIILDRILMRLALPTGKRSTVVGNDQFQPLRHSKFTARLLQHAPGCRDIPAGSSARPLDRRSRVCREFSSLLLVTPDLPRPLSAARPT